MAIGRRSLFIQPSTLRFSSPPVRRHLHNQRINMNFNEPTEALTPPLGAAFSDENREFDMDHFLNVIATEIVDEKEEEEPSRLSLVGQRLLLRAPAAHMRQRSRLELRALSTPTTLGLKSGITLQRNLHPALSNLVIRRKQMQTTKTLCCDAPGAPSKPGAVPTSAFIEIIALELSP